MSQAHEAASSDGSTIDPDLDRRHEENIGIGELLTHLRLDRRQGVGHRVRAIKIHGDPGAGRGRRRKFADLGCVGEGGQQGQDDGRDQTRGAHWGQKILGEILMKTAAKPSVRRRPQSGPTSGTPPNKRPSSTRRTRGAETDESFLSGSERRRGCCPRRNQPDGNAGRCWRPPP